VSTNQRQFTKRLLFTGRQVQRAANLLGAEACLFMGKRLVYSTPIDTGRAKSNWRASRSKAHSTILEEAHVPGSFGGSDPSDPRVYDTTAENMAAAIQQITQQCRMRKDNQPMYLTNNLHYLALLERGYDTHKRGDPKPAQRYRSGFVRDALLSCARYVRKKRTIKRALSRAGIRNVSVEVN